MRDADDASDVAIGRRSIALCEKVYLCRSGPRSSNHT